MLFQSFDCYLRYAQCKIPKIHQPICHFTSQISLVSKFSQFVRTSRKQKTLEVFSIWTRTSVRSNVILPPYSWDMTHKSVVLTHKFTICDTLTAWLFIWNQIFILCWRRNGNMEIIIRGKYCFLILNSRFPEREFSFLPAAPKLYVTMKICLIWKDNSEQTSNY